MMKMNCQIQWIKPWRILHFNFASQWDMSMTIIRMQEYYESPKFRGKVFSLEEYMDWYVKESEWGEKGKHFDYTSATGGFNIPGASLCEFYELFCDEIGVDPKGIGLTVSHRPREEWFFAQLEKKKIDLCGGTPFYIIGTYGEGKDALEHEIRHGIFHLLPKYRKEVLAAISKYGLKKFRNFLMKTGYHRAVVEDEMHAYALTGWIDGIAPTKEMESLKRDLKVVEKKYMKKADA